jgi:hypothetical protein
MMPKPDALRRRVEGLLADYIGCIDQEELERWPTFLVMSQILLRRS